MDEVVEIYTLCPMAMKSWAETLQEQAMRTSGCYPCQEIIDLWQRMYKLNKVMCSMQDSAP